MNAPNAAIDIPKDSGRFGGSSASNCFYLGSTFIAFLLNQTYI